MEYELQRSKRKTLVIQISKEAKIIVKAPTRLPQKDIDEFINQKENWIKERISVAERNYKARQEFSIKDGMMFLYQAKEYPVRIVDESSYFDGNYFYIKDGSQEELRNECIELYKKLALAYLLPLVNEYADKMAVRPLAVKVNNTRTYWGSCSSISTLNFSWRLMWTNKESIEYVVVHELAHIIQHNHSAEFWKIVESIIPDWKTRRILLKKYAAQIDMENWD